MASAAQIEANRLNAALSTGPATSTGKARSSRNHLKFGLFSTQNCVRPEETAEYTKLSKLFGKTSTRSARSSNRWPSKSSAPPGVSNAAPSPKPKAARIQPPRPPSTAPAPQPTTP